MDFKVTNSRPAGGTALREADEPAFDRPQPTEPVLGGTDPALPAAGRRFRVGRPYRIGRKWSWTQVVGSILIAGICVAAVVWYVPRVINNDRGMLTGAVSSAGVVTLNFQNAGVISVVKAQPTESVRKGQVLAVEYAPNVGAFVTADNAAISAVQAKVAELKTEETLYPLTVPQDQAQIASEKAQLATDQAQLATDSLRMAATEIVAPAAGVIVATNGQPGEAVTSSGIRNYSSSSQSTTGEQQPAFSLLPEGPQSTSHAAASGSSLPVIALRVSSSWSIDAFIPEARVTGIKVGQGVTVSVPAARIKHVRGRIQEILPNPVNSSTGPEYQAIIAITSPVATPPLDGMAADVELGH